MSNLIPKEHVARGSLEYLVLRSWDTFMRDTGDQPLNAIAIPAPLRADFETFKEKLAAEGDAMPQGKIIREQGREILRTIIDNNRKLASGMKELKPHLETETLTAKQWHQCLSDIIDRIGTESTYFQDSITQGALKIAEDGFVSKQFKAVIIPIKNEFLQGIIKQPIFFPDIGIILYPGKVPTPKEIVTTLAEKGNFPASFTKLQECVADILSWPLYKRVGSFAVSAVAGLLTMPFKLAVRAAITIPRIFGINLLKKTALPFGVDPVLDAAYSAMSTELNGKPHLEKEHARHLYAKAVKEKCPDEPKIKRDLAVKSILMLRALGFSIPRIGALINGARFSKEKKCYPKLERVILRECRKLKINSPEDRNHLLELDDSVWRLATVESKLQAMKIAREELQRALATPAQKLL